MSPLPYNNNKTTLYLQKIQVHSWLKNITPHPQKLKVSTLIKRTNHKLKRLKNCTHQSSSKAVSINLQGMHRDGFSKSSEGLPGNASWGLLTVLFQKNDGMDIRCILGTKANVFCFSFVGVVLYFQFFIECFTSTKPICVTGMLLQLNDKWFLEKY